MSWVNSSKAFNGKPQRNKIILRVLCSNFDYLTAAGYVTRVEWKSLKRYIQKIGTRKSPRTSSRGGNFLRILWF